MGMKPLKITQFGAPVLRQKARHLELSEIKSVSTKQLISNMHFTLTSKKLGIGLAAPQVGESLAIAVINIQKTDIRPDIDEFKLTIINPRVTRVFGRKSQQWEGCISSGAGKAGLFAKVPRYKKIELEYTDDQGKKHKQIFDGLPAHVIQHEVDHLNGVLFVDRVKDTTTYMTYSEYKRHKSQKLI